MIDSRNQFKTTKAGAIVYATKDIDLAYACGFKNGRASIAESGAVSDFTLSLCQKVGGMTPLKAYMALLHEADWSVTDNKMQILDKLNAVVGNNYNINALNNFIRGTKPVPQHLQSFMRDFVLSIIFGEQMGILLKELC